MYFFVTIVLYLFIKMTVYKESFGLIIEASVGQRRTWMIHRNVFFVFLIVLISCWVFAASRKAEKTNVGMAVVIAASRMAGKTNVRMAVVIADITSMCGFGSDGAVPSFLRARLSAAAGISINCYILK